jgi:uncharacterized protein (TIGR02996 family)
VTKAEALWAALEESPGDHELRGIYADFLEDNGAKKTWLEHNRMLVELARAPSLEKASCLYKDFHERTVYHRTYDRHTIACVEKWGVGDYLRMRAKIDRRWGLEGDELDGEYVRGWTFSGWPLSAEAIENFRPTRRRIGIVQVGATLRNLACLPLSELPQGFPPWEPYPLAQPMLLTKSAFGDETWVVAAPKELPRLFLIQRTGP